MLRIFPLFVLILFSCSSENPASINLEVTMRTFTAIYIVTGPPHTLSYIDSDGSTKTIERTQAPKRAEVLEVTYDTTEAIELITCATITNTRDKRTPLFLTIELPDNRWREQTHDDIGFVCKTISVCAVASGLKCIPIPD